MSIYIFRVLMAGSMSESMSGGRKEPDQGDSWESLGRR